ncbi:putative TetR family transcriptional regulator [Gordonia effusa NBRC 100432]|uniref:Putative TetR family transcriptional regulator n=1 Tax=Gordonia effusa NBRC 100432 TaxID=1077974 RepID=H0QUZ0_9ACTN|nr:TetR family transcriptional regulator [Gordonia effusa]GAB16641.1 putative TetR family transcriptional regulator [Gordonia effusa NBRC 100432]
MSDQSTAHQAQLGSDAVRSDADPSIAPQNMIRPARELAGISLRELARRIGVSAGTMSAIETGKTPASTQRLELIVAELGTTVELLSNAAPPAHSPERAEFDWRVYPDKHLDPVLAAAIACFVRTGYHGATMRTIAAEAGISVPGVYHHYASKQSLLVAGFDLAIAELGAHLPPARIDGTDPVARLRNLCTAIVLFATVRRDLARIVVNETRNVEAPDDSRVQTFTTELIMLLQNEIDAGVADGSLTADDPGAAALAILSLCFSVCQWDSPTTDPERVAARYARFAINLAREKN